MLDISFNRAIQIVYLKQLVTNFATQCFTPEGDHQANEYSYTISLDGLCDDARHIACANNLNLNYVFARACARLKFCALNLFLWRHFVKSSDLLFNVLSLFDFRIKIFSSKHRAGGRSCDLCLEEKIFILKSNKDKTLNKRSELFTKCRHRKRFNAQNFKRAHARANT